MKCECNFKTIHMEAVLSWWNNDAVRRQRSSAGSPICDWAIIVALRSHRGEKGSPSSASLSPWKKQWQNHSQSCTWPNHDSGVIKLCMSMFVGSPVPVWRTPPWGLASSGSGVSSPWLGGWYQLHGASVTGPWVCRPYQTETHTIYTPSANMDIIMNTHSQRERERHTHIHTNN